jgi:hypothetical protein
MMERRARFLGGVLIIGVGAVHLQQYLDFIRDVPTIGGLFLLNAFGAGAVCLMLAGPFGRVAAIGGIGLSLASLISILVARYANTGLFDYREPTWRSPIIVAVVLEITAVAALALAITAARQRAS